MSDPRAETIRRLRELPDRKALVENLPERIQELEHQYSFLKSSSYDKDPVSGGTNRREDALIYNIIERDRLKAAYEAAKIEVTTLERNLASLPKNERIALERFIINDERYAAERLSEDLGYERAQIYRIRESAINNLERRLYPH